MAQAAYSISRYLLDRLKELGVDHIFGVPGDFVLGFYHEIERSEIRCIPTCNELNAAYAADGYARIRGLGALATTYVVGELSALNGVAGAYAERVPVVQITGCPATKHYKSGTLLHHTLGDYRIPLNIYEKVTVASTLLENPARATEEIDRVLKECLYHNLPVYIGLPADVAMAPCEKPKNKLEIPPHPASDPNTLAEAVGEALQMIEKAERPVIVIDGEILRFGLEKQVQNLIEASGFPFAAMILGKTALDEHHPQFIGLYEGDRSRDYVKKRVEDADCILMLGPILTDFNTGGFTAKLDDGKTIKGNIDRIRIRYHDYHQVNFAEFLEGLARGVKRLSPAELDIKRAVDGCPHRATLHYKPEAEKKLTLQRFFDRASHFLNENSIMMVETGSALFAGAEVLQPKGCRFMSQTFFGSIGYTVGSTLGVALAAPDKRVCLFVGDGSFQVTCQDLSTMIRYKTNPIVFLINNDGYLVERVILDGAFNDLQPWQYYKLPEVFGGGWGYKVQTEGELEEALAQAQERTNEVVFIEVVLDKWDSPAAMTKAGEAMARANSLKK